MTYDDRTAEPRTSAQDHDAWLEHLLRQDAASQTYVDDDGFSARVTAKLPVARSRSRYRWIVPAMAILGAVIGLVAMSGGEALLLNIARLASFEAVSVQKLLLSVVPLGILYWIAVGAAWQQR